MAHGEAEQGRAQGEPCRPVHHEPPAAAGGPALQRRPPAGNGHPGDPANTRSIEQADEEPSVPCQRGAEPDDLGLADPTQPACRSDLPGWAGGHRHGPVRPRRRATRRERPPRRWC